MVSSPGKFPHSLVVLVVPAVATAKPVHHVDVHHPLPLLVPKGLYLMPKGRRFPVSYRVLSPGLRRVRLQSH